MNQISIKSGVAYGTVYNYLAIKKKQINNRLAHEDSEIVE